MDRNKCATCYSEADGNHVMNTLGFLVRTR
jgi:hypothetical protein